MEKSDIDMKKIFFHHIPKTGGQTLAVRMASAFSIGRSSIFKKGLKHNDGGIELLRSYLKDSDFIESHVEGPVLKEFEELDILLAVREPVGQIVSHYLHILREPVSPLCHPANILSPHKFFSEYSDFFANYQSYRFVEAYITDYDNLNNSEILTSNMLSCINNVRWHVPTQHIDEFCMLWQLETNQKMMLDKEYVNVAGVDAASRKELENIVVSMSELYSVDLLLYQIVKQRYEDYKYRTLQESIGTPYPLNWGHVWFEHDSGIWLGRGWHQPVFISDHYEYWAGPENLSEIKLKRKSTYRYLFFSVVVFCGLSPNDIQIFTAEGREIKMEYRYIQDHEVEYSIDLDGFNTELIFLKVQKVYSPAMLFTKSLDTIRKSVAVCKWRLVECT